MRLVTICGRQFDPGKYCALDKGHAGDCGWPPRRYYACGKHLLSGPPDLSATISSTPCPECAKAVPPTAGCGRVVDMGFWSYVCGAIDGGMKTTCPDCTEARREASDAAVMAERDRILADRDRLKAEVEAIRVQLYEEQARHQETTEKRNELQLQVDRLEEHLVLADLLAERLRLRGIQPGPELRAYLDARRKP